jgi:short-subunit dehydrogenase
MADVKTFENAFITGASSGIGRAVAERLGRRGTRVIVAARREAELQSLVESIRSEGGQADLCVLDVGQPDEVWGAVRKWERETGGLDLVIANAGVGKTKPAHKLAWEDVEPILRVNVVGAFATLMAGMEGMVARGRGTLVGVSSLAAMRGLPKSGAYAASKAALATFLETLRTDLGRKGIRVVDVRPGFVDTPMTKANQFKMPFLMDVDRAADVTMRGIERGEAIVSYPWPTASTMSVAQSMPDVAWRAIARWIRF